MTEIVYWSDKDQCYKDSEGNTIGHRPDAVVVQTVPKIEVCRPGIPGTETLVEAITPKLDPYAPPPAQPKTWAPSPTTALAEAAAIVSGPRRAAYGHPLDNHSRTAAMWSAFLGVPVTAEQVCWMNILQKASRNVCSEHRDNVVDTIGYAANIDIIKLEREARAASGEET